MTLTQVIRQVVHVLKPQSEKCYQCHDVRKFVQPSNNTGKHNYFHMKTNLCFLCIFQRRILMCYYKRSITRSSSVNEFFKCNFREINCFLSPHRCVVNTTEALNYIVNKANLVHNFSQYFYFLFLRVSGDHVPIIRRNNYVYATLGTCYSVWMTLWCAGWNAYQTVIHTK